MARRASSCREHDSHKDAYRWDDLNPAHLHLPDTAAPIKSYITETRCRYNQLLRARCA